MSIDQKDLVVARALASSTTLSNDVNSLSNNNNNNNNTDNNTNNNSTVMMQDDATKQVHTDHTNGISNLVVGSGKLCRV